MKSFEKTSWLKWFSIITLTVFLLLPEVTGMGWGETGHKTITRLAIDATPKPLRSMLMQHLHELEEASMDPDRRKSEPGVADESKRHYIDIDALEPYPFEAFPNDYNVAEAKYGRMALNNQGIVPWAIDESFLNLVEAWESGDENWMRWLGDLAHYVGDLHQPMHTTANFDGQKSDNRGIHALFESVMVDGFFKDEQIKRFRPSDKLWPAIGTMVPAGAMGTLISFSSAYLSEAYLIYHFKPVDDPLAEAFAIVRDTYTMLDPLLEAHTKAQEHRQTSPKFYSTFWDEGADKVMERQINKGAYTLARYLMGAWLKAGQPAF